jgi:hypothetical protein
MRPYWAVIFDSFHAALSSRILWVAFLAIWLLLGALAPIGYQEVFTTNFQGRDFYNGTQLKAMLARGLVDPAAKESPVGRIAAAMPEDLRRQLTRVGEGDEVRIRLNRLADALNQLLDGDQDWYDAEAWSGTVRLKELRELDAADDRELTEVLHRRRGRLRIEAALPGVFEGRSARSIALTYAGMEFPASFAIDKTQFVTLINQWVVPTIINWLLGFILVFLGILVTAHIVPDMLQPGSLHLLLSKPVSRTLLFLSKFVGGCAFVFLCVVQLVVGLYLVAGLRLDVWNVRMLWCIPVSVFLFSVFYSVSAVAGLRWRSPILAIGLTCMFGLFCFVIGFIGGLFDGLVTRPETIQHVVSVGDEFIASTRGGGLVHLDRSENRWVEIVESDAMSFDRVLAPIKLDSLRVATARVRNGRINPFGSGSLDLLVLSKAEDWRPEPSLRLPTSTTRLIGMGDGGVAAMNSSSLAITDRSSILDAAGEVSGEGQEAGTSGVGQDSTTDWLAKLAGMMGGATKGFRPLLPSQLTLAQPRGLVVNDSGDAMVVLSRGRLTCLTKPDAAGGDIWTVVAERQLEGDAARKFAIALSENVLMVAWPDSTAEIFDATDLTTLAEVELPSSLVPVGLVGLGDGKRFALVTSDGRCRIATVDATAAATLGRPLRIKEVESIAHAKEEKALLVVHHVDQLEVLDADTLEVRESVRPALARWRLVDRYVITPLRTLTPQTGELGETIAAMVSGKSGVTIEEGGEESQLVRYHMVRPVASCAGFIVFMLTVGCVYFARRDF